MKKLLLPAGIFLSMMLSVSGCTAMDEQWHLDMATARTISVTVHPYRPASLSLAGNANVDMERLQHTLDDVLRPKLAQQLASLFVRQLQKQGYSASVTAVDAPTSSDVMISIENPIIELQVEENYSGKKEFLIRSRATLKIRTRNSYSVEKVTFHHPRSIEATPRFPEKTFHNTNTLLRSYSEMMESGVEYFVRQYFEDKKQ